MEGYQGEGGYMIQELGLCEVRLAVRGFRYEMSWNVGRRRCNLNVHPYGYLWMMLLEWDEVEVRVQSQMEGLMGGTGMKN